MPDEAYARHERGEAFTATVTLDASGESVPVSVPTRLVKIGVRPSVAGARIAEQLGPEDLPALPEASWTGLQELGTVSSIAPASGQGPSAAATPPAEVRDCHLLTLSGNAAS